MILHGIKIGCADSAITLAALLTVDNLFTDSSKRPQQYRFGQASSTSSTTSSSSSSSHRPTGASRFAVFEGDPLTALSAFRSYQKQVNTLKEKRKLTMRATRKDQRKRRRSVDDEEDDAYNDSYSDTLSDGSDFDVDAALAALHAANENAIRSYYDKHTNNHGNYGSRSGNVEGGKGRNNESGGDGYSSNQSRNKVARRYGGSLSRLDNYDIDTLTKWCENQGLLLPALVRAEGLRGQIMAMLNHIQRSVGGFIEVEDEEDDHEITKQDGGEDSGWIANRSMNRTVDTSRDTFATGHPVSAKKKCVMAVLSSDNCPKRELSTRLLESLAIGFSEQIAVCVGYVTVRNENEEMIGSTTIGRKGGDDTRESLRRLHFGSEGGDDDAGYVDDDDDEAMAYIRSTKRGQSKSNGGSGPIGSIGSSGDGNTGTTTAIGYVPLSSWRAYVRNQSMSNSLVTNDSHILLLSPTSVLASLKPKVVVYGNITRTTHAYMRWVSTLTDTVLSKVAKQVQVYDIHRSEIGRGREERGGREEGEGDGEGEGEGEGEDDHNTGESRVQGSIKEKRPRLIDRVLF